MAGKEQINFNFESEGDKPPLIPLEEKDKIPEKDSKKPESKPSFQPISEEEWEDDQPRYKSKR